MNAFQRRRYHSIGSFLRDVGFIMRNRRAVRRLTRGGLEPKFRERLMLAVTQVNRCRHCSHAHTRAALKEGLSRETIAALLQGEFDDVPENELPALLYAQHWAESEGRPEQDAVDALEAAYDAEMVAQIDLVLRLIRTGNYMGNSLDYLLYRLSFGRLGGEATEQGQGASI